MVKKPERGNVVKSFMIGNTKVRICDDYCRSKTPEEIQTILDRIARNALTSINAEANRNNV